VLWDSEVRGLGLRLLPSGRKTRRALFELAEGEDPFVRREPGKMLRALEGEFTEACRRRVAAHELRASTAVKYTEHFAALKEALGHRLLEEIDEYAARRAFAEISERRGPYTANRALGVLRMVLRLACERGYRARSEPDPTAHIALHREAKRGLEFTGFECFPASSCPAGTVKVSVSAVELNRTYPRSTYWKYPATSRITFVVPTSSRTAIVP
jgi:hypothetical protein